MGYTHYWQGTVPEHTDELEDQIRSVFGAVESQGVALADGFGEGKPELTDERLWFNGKGDESYETFGVEFGAAVSDFCKTGLMPYDTAVVAVLELLRIESGGAFTWGSDGDGSDLLDAGKALAERIATA